jgi:clan AA aspartic protease (TIGR02281 family)
MQANGVLRIAMRTAIACLGLLAACAGNSVSQSPREAELQGHLERSALQRDGAEAAVSLKQSGGTFLVPVTINNTVQMPFIVDSGASDVSIPADVVDLLMKIGTISESDFLGKQTYRLADGSTVPTPTFRLRSVKVGDRVLENVTGSIALGSGGLLLGQSFLSRLRSWSIDNERKVLLLD